MKVADVIARTLVNYGVRWAFGIPGNDVLETIRACEEAGIRFVLAKSEPAAAFMADAVYHLTRRPAALIPALGPGLANATSGIAGAAQERSAIIVLGGEMARAQHGVYTHQVFDHVAAAAPVTKWSAPLNPLRAASQVAKALDIAVASPAGPVFLNIAADDGRAESAERESAHPARALPMQLASPAVAEARALIGAARRPLALVGLGALAERAPVALNRFAETWRVPVLTTYKAKGVIDEHRPLALGALGLSPVVDQETLRLIAEADALILIGFDPIELRDAWLAAWPASKPCLSIDAVAPAHRVFPTGLHLVGDVATILDQLVATGAAAESWPEAMLGDYRSRVGHIVRPRRAASDISPAALFAAVSEQLRPDWLLTVDVGAHRILANHVIRCRTPGQLLQSNGLGCMGYALPAAIGAQLVHPERPVVALIGDGCMLMTQGELALAAELDLPLVIVVLNDDALSLIKLKQAKMQLQPRAVDFRSPRFDRVAEGFGARGLHVDSLGAFASALADAVASRRLAVIDAKIDPVEYAEQM
jgi:acetolactate synthase-1/2/3 large subunit